MVDRITRETLRMMSMWRGWCGWRGGPGWCCCCRGSGIPLVRHRTLLLQAMERAVPAGADRRFASSPDRQGIG
ncbi:hypothetical protein [Streptomyces tubercidicus]|uniref:hypothetical protein n=1 Tax=Streptomyces tubercidicus TaxID=47759 RepID=UPI001356A55A|nr:hypothetical protein [Streptomyces tubercidicus]WAU16836.1 hypothetical protein STRTU_001106 [Streptomyces tubercidicus]